MTRPTDWEKFPLTLYAKDICQIMADEKGPKGINQVMTMMHSKGFPLTPRCEGNQRPSVSRDAFRRWLEGQEATE